MKEIILIKNGELSLKGRNRKFFEDTLINNIRAKIKSIGSFHVKKGQSVIYVEPNNDVDKDIMDEVYDAMFEVFGIASICRCAVSDNNLEDMEQIIATYLGDELSNTNTFKVETKRADKRFSLKSPDVSRKIGGRILATYKNLSVNVHNPEITVNIEIRENGSYIHSGGKRGAGGLPVSTSGKTAVMMSGGIDSPVAAYMMARRGLRLLPVHFESPPYTSERAKQKVVDLCKQLSKYAGDIPLYIVPFTDIQNAIKEHCSEEYFTIIMRRIMCIITEKIARRKKAMAITNGESLGQVASQTIEAICSTDDVCSIPVFRPLIGMDKIDIIEISKNIGTYETSILPYEDCCTVFTPKNPKTKPLLVEVKKQHEKFDFSELIEQALSNIEIINVLENNDI